MKKIKPIYAVLIIALIARLVFFFRYHDIWWDSAVYIGMGKYLFSGGTSGLWEGIRPAVWPFLLGYMWKLGLNPVFWGRVLELIFSLGIIYLVHEIAEKIYGKKAAFLSSIIIAFSSVFFFFTFRLYTEIPAIFFVLLGYYLYLKGENVWAGILVGIGFLTKFPAGIFLLPLLFIQGKQYKKMAFIAAGFSIPVFLYLIFNYITYGSFFSSLILAAGVINKVLGCNILFKKPWYFYFERIFRDNLFSIFALVGIWKSFQKISRNKLLIIFAAVFPLIYFLQLTCKDYRYIILFMPFIAILAGNGITALGLGKRRLMLAAIIITLISGFFAISYYIEQEPLQPHWSIEFFSYPAINPVEGEIAATNPAVTLYVDNPINPIYYPLYNSSVANSFSSLSSMIMLDSCNGGMICPPDDTACPEATEAMISNLNNSRELLYHKLAGPCEYFIFGSNKSLK